jgi:Glycosyltransferase like family
MIAFGASIADAASYRRYCEAGISRVAEPDSEIYAFAATGYSLVRTYNLILDAVADRDDLEALALLHPHAEITDAGFASKVRKALADPYVAVVGCAGAAGVRSIAWWEGEVRCGHVVHRHTEFGGGEVPAFGWTCPAPAPGEVDAVDGFLMVLSPWAVENVRFDEALPLGHGFEVDYCLQVREAGRKVLVADLGATFHRSLELVSEEDREPWIEAHVRMARKWQGRWPHAAGDDGEVDWRRRARRAEAEREVAHIFAHSNLLGSDALVQQLERELTGITDTAAWRLTEPLRRVNHWRAERRRSRRD